MHATDDLDIDCIDSPSEFSLIAVVEGASGHPLRRVKGSTKFFKSLVSRKQSSKKGKEKEVLPASEDDEDDEDEDVDCVPWPLEIARKKRECH